MPFAGDAPQLADVKVVDGVYPMYGELETSPPGLQPEPGTALPVPRLLALLNLKVGDNIDVGDVTLRITGEVIQEPYAGFHPFQIAPRLLMNLAPVEKTAAVQPGSCISWCYKFGGDAQQLQQFEN